MKKKILVLLALLLALTLVFIACDKKNPQDPVDTTVADQTTEEPTQDIEDPTEAPSIPEDTIEEPTETPTEELTAAPTEKPTEKPETPTEPPVTQEPETDDPMKPVNVFGAEDISTVIGGDPSNMTQDCLTLEDGYIHVVPIGPDPYWYPFAGVDGARYVAIRYRTDATGADIQMYIGSTGNGPSDDSTMLRQPVIADSEWHVAIFDTQSLIEAGKYDGKYVSYFRFDALEAGYILDENGEPYKPDGTSYARYTLPEGCSIDVAYIGFFHNEDAAAKYDFEQYPPFAQPEESGKIAHSFDTFYLNNQMYFPEDGGAGDKLTAQNNTLTFESASDLESIALRGWIGFNQPIDQFGYYVDNYEFVFGEYKQATEAGVLAAGGEYATRFQINVPLDYLIGDDHFVGFVVKLADGTIVQLRAELIIDLPDLPKDITDSFVSDVNSNEIGTSIDASDLGNFFMVELPLGGCAVEANGDGKVYNQSSISDFYTDVNGRYFFKANVVDSNGAGWMFVRGYKVVNSDEIIEKFNPEAGFYKINNYYETDAAGAMGGAGIYARLQGGKLFIMVKHYNPESVTRVGNKTFVIDAAGTELTMADNGVSVSVMVDGVTYATIEMSGSVTYGDINEVQPDGAFAEKAVITLKNGTTETIENTLIAATCECQIGVVARAGFFKFDALSVGGYTAIEVPTLEIEIPEDPEPVDPDAPVLLITPEFINANANSTGGGSYNNMIGSSEVLTEDGMAFVKLTANGGDPYVTIINIGSTLSLPKYMAISYRTNTANNGQFFMGSGAGWTGNGDSFLVNWNEDGNWNNAIVDLTAVGLTSIQGDLINYCRFDFFAGESSAEEFIAIEYIAFFNSAEAAEKYFNTLHGIEIPTEPEVTEPEEPETDEPVTDEPVTDEPETEEPEAPVVIVTPSEAGLKAVSFDTFYVNGSMYFPQDGGAGDKLTAQNNTILFNNGDLHESMGLRGWIGFKTQAIEQFGYYIDGGEIVYGEYKQATEAGVLAAGGEYATRFQVNVPLSGLSNGSHIVGFVARLTDGTVVLLRAELTVGIVPFHDDENVILADRAGGTTPLVSPGTSFGQKFNTGANFLKQLTIADMATYADGGVNTWTLKIWTWNTDYATTVAGEPVYVVNGENHPDNKSLTVNVPAYLQLSGELYYEVYYNSGKGGFTGWNALGTVQNGLETYIGGKLSDQQIASSVLIGVPADPNAIKQDTHNFQSNVNSNLPEGTNQINLMNSDLKNLFSCACALGGPCTVNADPNGAFYNVNGFSSLHVAANGAYVFTIENVNVVAAPGFASIFFRANKVANPEQQYYGADGGDATASSHGGSGIYLTIDGGKLVINVKSYADGAYSSNKFSVAINSTTIRIADDGTNVYIIAGDELVAVINIAGSRDFGINGVAADALAETVTITFADGTSSTIENAIVASKFNNGHLGIATRGAGSISFTGVALNAFDSIEIPVFPHVHNYNAVVTAPSCTEGGYTTYTCECGDTYTADETAATGHNFVSGTCTVCGAKDPDYVMTPEDIVNAAYGLAEGATLDGTFTLTGVIVAVDEAYNSNYGNITVTIIVGDMTDKPIKCYRMKGDGIEALKKGDTITVTGTLKNYYGTIEFDTGCTASDIVAGPEIEPEVPAGDSVTIDFTDKANRTEFDASVQVWANGDFVLTNNKGNSTSSVADYAAPARFYKSSDVIFAFPGMTKLVLEASGVDKYLTALKDSLTAAGIAYTADGTTVTIEFETPVDSLAFSATGGQFRLNSATVYYAEAEAPHEHDYSYETIVIDPTCTEEGYTVHKCECGDGYIDNETPAAGHNFVEGICGICGETDPNYVPETPDEPEVPALNELVVTTTDNYCWIDMVQFTAPVSGTYTFFLPAGLGAWDAIEYDTNPWGSRPFFDFYDNAEGDSFTVEITAGATYSFYIGALTKQDWTITYSVAEGEVGGGENPDTPDEPEAEIPVIVVGVNSIVVTDAMYEAQGFATTITVDAEGTYNFRGNFLVRVYNAMGMQVGIGTAYLTPGTYDLQVITAYLPGAGTYDMTVEYVAPENPEEGGDDVEIPEGAIEFPYTLTVDGEHDIYFDFAPAEDCVVKITYTLGNFVSGLSDYDRNTEECYYIARFEGGQVYSINPWGSSAGTYTFEYYTEGGEVEPPHEHEYVATDVIAPTCTEDGYTVYRCECEDSYIADETPATGHNHNADVTAPTCQAGGYTTYTCACGDSYTADETAKVGHSFYANVCTYCGGSLPTYSANAAIVKHLSFDQLYVGPTPNEGNIFTPGGEAAWNKVAVIDSTVPQLYFWGWIGYMGEFGQFGYQIDCDAPVFDASFAVAAAQDVINAATAVGADGASRMRIAISTANLTPGVHSVYALYKNAAGDVVSLSSFKILIVDDEGQNATTYYSGNDLVAMGAANATVTSNEDASAHVVSTDGVGGKNDVKFSFTSDAFSDMVVIKYKTNSPGYGGNYDGYFLLNGVQFIGNRSKSDNWYEYIGDDGWHYLVLNLRRNKATSSSAANTDVVDGATITSVEFVPFDYAGNKSGKNLADEYFDIAYIAFY